MRVRAAKSDDLPDIHALLSGANLTTIGVAEHLDAFFVCDHGESVVGVGGFESRGLFGLLRSLTVAPEYQGRGLASAICDQLESEAASRGIESIYLLTETAERFFSNRGYIVVPRSEASPEIASSEQFSAICPASAVLMGRAAQQCPTPSAESR
jgi:amino-acid N-acetyltransferase